MLYPPDRIRDLKVLDVDEDTRIVTLKWTAVGAQADVGTGTFLTLSYKNNYP